MDGSHLPDDLATTELAAGLERGELPTVKAPDPLAPDDECHFVSPVVSVAWSEVAEVQRARREVVVSLRDSRRLLRFSCHSEGEAARGALIAQHLVQSAQTATADSETPFHHAAL
jgi:hypothetical protein